MKLNLEIVTPERLFLSQQVDEVQVPALDGELGILPGHIPLISQLAIAGILSCRADGVQTRVVLNGGFVEVGPNKVMILTSYAKFPTEIDLDTAKQELDLAERALKAAEKDPNVDIQEALIKLEKAAINYQAASQ
ncbi:MAG: ATP synthase F1 subunit epsilon [Acidobacteriota bacterium]|nr:ATP synthase F1 subunit epsilon [Blastocatellia bacterium]MDW8413501.1 ATP synthase F1 subunit epsilon [Acidobacteriota bacterium]